MTPHGEEPTPGRHKGTWKTFILYEKLFKRRGLGRTIVEPARFRVKIVKKFHDQIRHRGFESTREIVKDDIRS